MKSLIFLDKKEAKECFTTMKEKGFKVQEPERQSMPKGSRKVYDLNGKPIKSRWVVKLSEGGKGYGGAGTVEEAEYKAFKAKVEAYPTEKESAAKSKREAKEKRDRADARATVEAQWAERKREGKKYEQRAYPEEGKGSYAEAEAKAKEMRKQKVPGGKRKTYILKGKKPGEYRVVAGTKKELEAPRTLSAAQKAEKSKWKKRKKLFEKPLREAKHTRRPMRTTARHIKASMLHKPSSFIPLRGKHPLIGGGTSMEYRRPRIAQLPGQSKDITDMSLSPFGG